MTIARGFARYLAGIDARTEVPPPGLIAAWRWRPASGSLAGSLLSRTLLPRFCSWVSEPRLSHCFEVLGSGGVKRLREPEKGANVFGLRQTQRDPLRAFAQVKGSPFDSCRLGQTHPKRAEFR